MIMIMIMIIIIVIVIVIIIIVVGIIVMLSTSLQLGPLLLFFSRANIISTEKKPYKREKSYAEKDRHKSRDGEKENQ